MINLFKSMFVEIIGTFFLVFIGCGVAIIAGAQIGLLGVALAFGLTLMAMAYAIGPVSGCHINPAVSVGMLFSGNMNVMEFIGYIIAQSFGACLAGFALLYVASGNADYNMAEAGLAATGFGDHSPNNYTMISCAIVEILATFLLVITVLSTTRPSFPPGAGGLAVGVALAAGILFAGNITNASLNPARSLGVAVFEGGWAIEQLWFFWAMPFIGGLCAAIVHKIVD